MYAWATSATFGWVMWVRASGWLRTHKERRPEERSIESTKYIGNVLCCNTLKCCRAIAWMTFNYVHGWSRRWLTEIFVSDYTCDNARDQTNRCAKCKEMVHTSKECNPNSFTSVSKHIRNGVSGYSHIPKSHAYPMRYKLSKFTRRNNEERVSSVNLAIVDGNETMWVCTGLVYCAGKFRLI